MQRRQPSAEDGDPSVVGDADVGVFVAAVGVRHRRQHQPHQIPVEAGQIGVQVHRLPPCQRRDDPQDALLAAGQSGEVVVGDRLVVQPPPARLIARLDPRIAWTSEPAIRGTHQ
jgi:hypothetical protein